MCAMPWPTCSAYQETREVLGRHNLNSRAWGAHTVFHYKFLRADLPASCAANATYKRAADIGRMEVISSRIDWRYCPTCVDLRKPGPSGQPKYPVERL